MKKIKLRCTLYGSQRIYKSGDVIKASIQELNELCHVIEIKGERFGVYDGYYKIIAE